MRLLRLARRGLLDLACRDLAHLSSIQAGFFRVRQMTGFSCFWGLQSGFKQLSIYTVVLLYDGNGLEQVESPDQVGNTSGTN